MKVNKFNYKINYKTEDIYRYSYSYEHNEKDGTYYTLCAFYSLYRFKFFINV